jgi:hypothetical protein
MLVENLMAEVYSWKEGEHIQDGIINPLKASTIDAEVLLSPMLNI